FAEAVLPHVVAEPELEGASHLLKLVHERGDFDGDLAPVPRRAARADVDDVHRRDRLALARERAAPNVTQAPADHFLRLDVGEQQRLFETRCAGYHLAFVVDDDGVPVEDQLVLPADGVAKRDEARVVARARDEHLLSLTVASDIERRGGDVDEQLRTGERKVRRRWPRLPHVLADGRADERLPVLEENEVSTGCEIPVLVEDAVVRQEALPVDGL